MNLFGGKVHDILLAMSNIHDRIIEYIYTFQYPRQNARGYMYTLSTQYILFRVIYNFVHNIYLCVT